MTSWEHSRLILWSMTGREGVGAIVCTVNVVMLLSWARSRGPSPNSHSFFRCATATFIPFCRCHVLTRLVFLFLLHVIRPCRSQLVYAVTRGGFMLVLWRHLEKESFAKLWSWMGFNCAGATISMQQLSRRRYDCICQLWRSSSSPYGRLFSC